MYTISFLGDDGEGAPEFPTLEACERELEERGYQFSCTKPDPDNKGGIMYIWIKGKKSWAKILEQVDC